MAEDKVGETRSNASPMDTVRSCWVASFDSPTLSEAPFFTMAAAMH